MVFGYCTVILVSAGVDTIGARQGKFLHPLERPIQFQASRSTHHALASPRADRRRGAPGA